MEIKFRELRADEIEVRIDQIKASYCILLLYKNSRVDMNILDETVGAMNWQRRHSRDNANCQVGIYDSDKKEWVWKEDTGTESNTEAEKGLASDSFKRAGTNWGIGRELYTKLKIRVDCKTDKNEKGKLIVTNLFDFEVDKIDIQNKTIVGLVISAYNSDIKKREVIYSYGTLKQPKQEPKKADKKEPPKEEEKKEPLTLDKAKAMTFMAKGKEYKLGECNSEQLLYLRDNIKDKEFLEGVNLILTDMAMKSYTDQNENNNQE